MRKRFANRIGQRLIALVAALTVAIGCAAVFVGCSDKADSPPPEIAAEIALDAAEKTAYVGDTFRLAATVKNTDDAVSWYSSNAEVAAVLTDGTVTVFSVGTATEVARSIRTYLQHRM